MGLFTCKKYDFLIEKNLRVPPNLLALRPLGSNAAEFPPPPKNQHNLTHKLKRTLESEGSKRTFLKCSNKNEVFYLQKV